MAWGSRRATLTLMCAMVLTASMELLQMSSGGRGAASKITAYVHLDANSTHVFTPSPDNFTHLLVMPFRQGPSPSSQFLGKLMSVQFTQPPSPAAAPYEPEPAAIPIMQIFSAYFDRGTLALLAPHYLRPEQMELAIVGGTGHFCLARGFATFKAPPRSPQHDGYKFSVHFTIYPS